MRKYGVKAIDKQLQAVFEYFAIFSYAPTVDQIHTFYSKKIEKNILLKQLTKYVKSGGLVEGEVAGQKIFSFAKQIDFINIRNTRHRYSNRYYQKAMFVSKVIGMLPQVQMIGLTGSVAVENATQRDDIDFFIISKRGEMWTCRLLVVFLLQIMGVRRSRGEKNIAGKICCNLFFDGRNLTVSTDKRSCYTAHEVLQTKPLLSKNNYYEKFIRKNSWVFDYFPNATKHENHALLVGKLSTGMSYGSVLIRWLSFFSIFERLFRIIQLTFINKHRTIETITDTQLWFFPFDISKMRGLKKFV